MLQKGRTTVFNLSFNGRLTAVQLCVTFVRLSCTGRRTVVQQVWILSFNGRSTSVQMSQYCRTALEQLWCNCHTTVEQPSYNRRATAAPLSGYNRTTLVLMSLAYDNKAQKIKLPIILVYVDCDQYNLYLHVNVPFSYAAVWRTMSVEFL